MRTTAVAVTLMAAGMAASQSQQEGLSLELIMPSQLKAGTMTTVTYRLKNTGHQAFLLCTHLGGFYLTDTRVGKPAGGTLLVEQHALERIAIHDWISLAPGEKVDVKESFFVKQGYSGKFKCQAGYRCPDVSDLVPSVRSVVERRRKGGAVEIPLRYRAAKPVVVSVTR
jgi:hypothetical protein